MPATPACVKEACAVGLAEGAEVAPEPSLAALEGAPEAFRSLCKRTWPRDGPELEVIAGPILRGGSKHGIEVPASRLLVDRIARAT